MAKVERRRDHGGAEVVQKRDRVDLHALETGRGQVQRPAPPAIDLSCRRLPKDGVEHDVRQAVVVAAHLARGHGEGVRIRARARPWHGKGAKVGYLQGFGNVYSSHGARRLDEKVGFLAGGPG